MKVYINEISYFDLLLCYTPMLPKIFPGDCSYHMTGLIQLTILDFQNAEKTQQREMKTLNNSNLSVYI